jgi:hypothetical protein
MHAYNTLETVKSQPNKEQLVKKMFDDRKKLLEKRSSDVKQTNKKLRK